MRILTFVAIIFMTMCSLAATPWETLQNFIGETKVCEAFVDGATYTIDRKTCSFSCDEWSYWIKTFCSKDKKTGEDLAEIQYWKKDGMFSQEKVTAQRWSDIKGNLLIAKAESDASFGVLLVLNSAEERTAADGTPELVIQFDHKMKNTINETELWVVRKGPAIFQHFSKQSEVKKPFRETREDNIRL